MTAPLTHLLPKGAAINSPVLWCVSVKHLQLWEVILTYYSVIVQIADNPSNYRVYLLFYKCLVHMLPSFAYYKWIGIFCLHIVLLI